MKAYYERSGPMEPSYLTDEGRPTVGWLMRQRDREGRVTEMLEWSLADLKEHEELLLKALTSQMLPRWQNCLNNLRQVIVKLDGGNPDYLDQLKAHAYENWDLSP